VGIARSPRPASPTTLKSPPTRLKHKLVIITERETCYKPKAGPPVKVLLYWLLKGRTEQTIGANDYNDYKALCIHGVYKHVVHAEENLSQSAQVIGSRLRLFRRGCNM